MRRTRADGVAVWFWPRGDANVPPEVRGVPMTEGAGGGLLGGIVGSVAGSGARVMEPNAVWGLPEAEFPPNNCDASHFNAHMMIFDLTFCVCRTFDLNLTLAHSYMFQGDWAGSIWPISGCALTSCATCESLYEEEMLLD